MNSACVGFLYFYFDLNISDISTSYIHWFVWKLGFRLFHVSWFDRNTRRCVWKNCMVRHVQTDGNKLLFLL